MRKKMFKLELLPAMLLACVVVLGGCQKEEENPFPEKVLANFEMSASEVGALELVSFTNKTVHAEQFEWDFGDGATLKAPHAAATHRYTKADTFTVTLTATANDGSTSKLSRTIVVTPYKVITDTKGNELFKMMYVEGGEFKMGGTGADQKPEHQVTLDNYYMGELPVTQKLWKTVMDGKNPSLWVENENAVESVSYEVITKKFLPALNKLTGKHFTLPTEAQWEFAARGGKQSKGLPYAGTDNQMNILCLEACEAYGIGKLIPVPAFNNANELGLFDMSGMVCEWCSDYYGKYSAEAQENPTGPLEGKQRVLRGGSYLMPAADCTVSARQHSKPTVAAANYGFRLCWIP